MIRKIKNKLIAWLDRSLAHHRNMTALAVKPTAMIDSSAIMMPESAVVNPSSKPELIQVGANSVVRGSLVTFAHGGNIKIGSECYVGHRSEIWSMQSIHIGDRVLISHDCNIHDSSGHSMVPRERHLHYQAIRTTGHPKRLEDAPGVKIAPITIEDDVWISFGVTILRGVKIGARSVIAAGAIVTKDVPPDTLYRCAITPIMTLIAS